MSVLGTTGAAVGAVTGSVAVTERMVMPKKTPEIDLDKKVSIHVPTLNEEDYIAETLISLMRQYYYRFTDTKLIVLDSHSEDRTVQIAEQFADDVWLVPEGKLSARNAGIKRDDADIVVNVDAGAHYPQHWLSHLLKPFEDKNVVATQGFTLAKDPMWKLPYLFSSSLRPISHLSGHNSAIDTQTYTEIGGFDLTVNQTDVDEIWKEEERVFLQRMKTQGKVKFVPKAVCFESQRRRFFSLESMDKEYKREIKSGKRF